MSAKVIAGPEVVISVIPARKLVRNSLTRNALIVAILAFAAPLLANQTIHLQIDIHNAENGGVNNSFTKISDAISYARQLASVIDQDTTIVLNVAAGEHHVNETIDISNFDSNPNHLKLVLRGAGIGKTRILGSIPIPLNEINDCEFPLPDRVLRTYCTELPTNLPLARFTWSRHWDTHSIREIDAPNEVYVNGRRLAPAAYPNTGFLSSIVTINGGTSPRAGDELREGAVLQLNNRDPLPMLGLDKAWARGFWMWPWYEEAIPVKEYSHESGRLVLARPHYYGVGPVPRVRLMNQIAFLDLESEYYIDVPDRKLHLSRAIDLSSDTWITITVTTNALLRIADSSNVEIRDMELSETRGAGLVVENSSNIVVSNVMISRTGTTGAVVVGGRDVRFNESTIAHTGTKGLHIRGGRRDLLEESGHEFAAGEILSASERFLAGAPSVILEGVGASIRGVQVSGNPHTGVLLKGNEHEVSSCKIDNICESTSDCGAIYIGRDWTARGHKLLSNIVEGRLSTQLPLDNNAFYLDDFASGVLVEDNYAKNFRRGVLVGGGRDNVIKDNQFENVSSGVVIDERGKTWASEMIQNSKSELRKALAKMPIHSDRWTRRYPELPFIMRKDPAAATGNVVTGNVTR